MNSSIDLTIENSVAVLHLKNEKKLNALSEEFCNDIHSALNNIEQKAKVLIVHGIERAFIAGVNINEIDQFDFEQGYRSNFINEKWEALWHTKIPTIAAVSGYALGGGFEFCLMCDIIVAAENAKFGFPEINLGLMPGLGGTQLLPRLVGPKIASYLLLTSDYISAKEAFDLGIVNKVTSPENLLTTAQELASKIAAKPDISARLIKEAIRLSQNTGLDVGMQVERNYFRSLFATSDKNNNVKDFVNKHTK